MVEAIIGTVAGVIFVASVVSILRARRKRKRMITLSWVERDVKDRNPWP